MSRRSRNYRTSSFSIAGYKSHAVFYMRRNYQSNQARDNCLITREISQSDNVPTFILLLPDLPFPYDATRRWNSDDKKNSNVYIYVSNFHVLCISWKQKRRIYCRILRDTRVMWHEFWFWTFLFFMSKCVETSNWNLV